MPDIKWPMPQVLIAMIVVVSVMALLFMLLFVPLPADNTILNLVIGGVMTTFATIIGFYFGSSAGSKNKEEAIISAAVRAPAQPAPQNGGADTVNAGQ